MTDRDNELGQRLADQEASEPDARARYDRNVRRLLERRISRGGRLVVLLLGLFFVHIGFLGLVKISGEALRGPDATDALRWITVASMLSIGAALLAIFGRGVYSAQREGAWLGAGCLLMLAAWGGCLYWAAFDPANASLHGVFAGLANLFCAAAALATLTYWVSRRHLAMQRKLLEVELQVAELTARLHGGE